MDNREERTAKAADLAADMESLRLERIRIHDAIRRNKTMRDELYLKNRYGIRFSPVASFIIFWIVELLVVLFTVFYVVQNSGVLLVFVLILVSIIISIAALNLLLVYPRIGKMKKIDEENIELEASSRELDGKIKALEYAMKSDKASGVK